MLFPSLVTQAQRNVSQADAKGNMLQNTGAVRQNDTSVITHESLRISDHRQRGRSLCSSRTHALTFPLLARSSCSQCIIRRSSRLFVPSSCRFLSLNFPNSF